MKILHISESFEGGVASAVANYVDLTSEHEHFLLCNKRSGRLSGGILHKFSTVYDLTRSHFSALKTVHAVVDKVKPDVIHCHSSYGGGYARLAYFFARCPALMVYSPHCYAFERRDISWFGRKMFYIMEWVLARRTDVVVCCSLRERNLARMLRKKTKSIYVPNMESVASDASLPFRKRKNMVVMVGRLCPQKDPGWFAEVAREVEREVEFVWVGDGEKKYRKVLKDAGVRVTGWKSPKEVAKILGESKVYLQTALWEGFPIALLDGARCGVAVVAREAMYLEGVRNARAVGSSVEAAEEIDALLGEIKEWKLNRERWKKALTNNNAVVAKKRLCTAYNSKT